VRAKSCQPASSLGRWTPLGQKTYVQSYPLADAPFLEYDMVRVPEKRVGTKRTHPYWRKGGKEMMEPRTIPPMETAPPCVGWSLEIGSGG
jgi:hypothetical protein